MTCPDDGTWRAWLDSEAVIDGADSHLQTCTQCRALVDELTAHAAHAAGAIALLAPPALRVAAATDVQAAGSVKTRPRWARAGAGVAAAVTAIAVLATPGGRQAAADFLDAFRSDRLALVEMEESDIFAVVGTFEQLGTVRFSDGVASPREVETMAQVTRVMGDDVLVPSPETLPQGVSAVPRLMVSNGGTVRFTFDEQRTKTFIREHGGDHQIPAGYDGATLIVTVPAASLQEYSTRQGLPALMVGQSSTVSATVDGELSLEALRGFLLGLPGLPPQVVSQLEGFDDWRSTLPIPIPLDEVNATDTTVDGADAVLVSEPGLGTGLVWQRDGRITGVAGTVDEGQLRRIAAGLQTAP